LNDAQEEFVSAINVEAEDTNGPNAGEGIRAATVGHARPIGSLCRAVLPLQLFAGRERTRMSVKLLEEVLNHPHLPARWKPIMMVLAWRAHNDDGTGLFVSVHKLTLYLHQHRVTVSRLLSELSEAGLVLVVRPGGRRLATPEQPGRVALRRSDVPTLRAFSCSDAITWSARRKESCSAVASRRVASGSRVAT